MRDHATKEYCDYEKCPGYQREHRPSGHRRMRLIYHRTYLHLHAPWCELQAKHAAADRGETFGYRMSL